MLSLNKFESVESILNKKKSFHNRTSVVQWEEEKCIRSVSPCVFY